VLVAPVVNVALTPPLLVTVPLPASEPIYAVPADGDYQSASGTLTFTAGQTSQTVTVLVNGDTTVELDETFSVHLSNAINATISDADGTGPEAEALLADSISQTRPTATPPLAMSAIATRTASAIWMRRRTILFPPTYGRDPG